MILVIIYWNVLRGKNRIVRIVRGVKISVVMICCFSIIEVFCKRLL